MFCGVFLTHCCALSYINTGSYIQLLVLGTDLNKQILALILRPPTAFEMLLFLHTLHFVHKTLVEKKLRIYAN